MKNPNDRVSESLPLSSAECLSFQKEIWDFYRKHGRSFPWRETYDPYAILVSELMLQQTQTTRVVKKFEIWMANFPTLESLAVAPLSEVLSLWNGLGYNRRAVYLQNACREISSRFDSVFPQVEEELKTLPGIGPYTAAALCAFAFNQATVFLETNIRSLFIHRFFSTVSGKIDDKVLFPLVAQTLDKENPREWYYALMDFGADIKTKLANPSKKSKSYTKQSRFQSSLRQARGAIIRQLVQKKHLSLAEISKEENIEMERLSLACKKLLEENFIVKKDDILMIRE